MLGRLAVRWRDEGLRPDPRRAIPPALQAAIPSAVAWWTTQNLTDGQRHAVTTGDCVLTDLPYRALGWASASENRSYLDPTAAAFDLSHTLRHELGHLLSYTHTLGRAVGGVPTVSEATRSPRTVRRDPDMAWADELDDLFAEFARKTT